MAEADDLLAAWEQRCRSHGLSITASRRAILTAMLQSETKADAVAWLLAAQRHHARTSLGTVYRFLRDMEHLGLVDVQAEPHSRCRWRLHEMAAVPLPDEPDHTREPLRLLQQIASSLGYRLVARHPSPAY